MSKKYLTLPEVKIRVQQLELRCERIPELYGYRPADFIAMNKALITLCTSLSLIFVQHELVFDGLALLKKALVADRRLFEGGELVDQMWPGRFHTFNSLSYLFQNLKFIRESIRLSLAYFPLSCEKLARPLRPEVALETHFMAFLILWKVGKYQDALTYIKICTQAINDINRQRCGVFSQKTRLNLVGLVAMSLAACIVKNEGDVPRGVDIISQCLSQLSSLDVEAAPLMLRFLPRLHSYRHPPTPPSSTTSFSDFADGLTPPDYSLPGLPAEYFEKMALQAAGLPTQENRPEDLLITKEFETLFFITVFMSHIDPSTPLIRESELELAEARQHSTFLPKHKGKLKTSSKLFPQHKDLPVMHSPGYLRLFRNIITKSKAKVGAGLDRINGVVREQRGQARDRAFSNRPPHRRADSDGQSSEEYSEARTKSVPPKSRLAYLSPNLNQNRLSPNLAILQDLQRSKRTLLRARNTVETMQQEAESRRRTKQNIMVQFSPRAQGDQSDVEITLQPIGYSALTTPNSTFFQAIAKERLRKEGEWDESL